MALTDKQKRFCEEYLIDLNATQAAIRAGYSPKTAEQTASRLLRNVKVQEYIAKDKRAIKEYRDNPGESYQGTCLDSFSNNADYAHVVEKKMQVEAGGALVDVLDKDGKPVMYRTVEPVLTEELTEEQKRALAVIKKGRDGLEVKSCDKVKALELLGKHLGIFTDKIEANVNDTTRSELQELLAQRKARGEPDASK